MAVAGPVFPTVSLLGLNLRTLMAATSTTEDCIQLLCGLGLLATNMDCRQCGDERKEMNDSKRNDDKRWRCTHVETKHAGKSARYVREAFFGVGSQLELKTIIDFLYLYAFEMATCKSITRECGLATEATVNWRNFVRDIFGEHFLQHPARIGGPGLVEIDESAFSKRKAIVLE
ncbi:hypothetical protein ElyMa_000049200 [Elysia marginata]|uniref:ISXO2-like transposase domain-containing protein n=1 Tax=Elysia marginata TaxID=1093978 RepID=A0AAV4EES1_9GAST|nr:hypothetical protein ElyMa_000049200 [Elysia marginata]